MEFLEKILGLPQATPKLAVPKKFKVILVNDDYTPMDFVVKVLEEFFHFETEKAIYIMLQVHKLGKGICGVFTKDIAETKAALVNDYARHHEHPLLCSIEPE